MAIFRNAHEPNSASALPIWRQRAYGYREAALLTFGIGITLHLSRLVLGDATALRLVLRPWVDETLALIMVYTSAAGLAGWKCLAFRGPGHRRLSKFILGFIVVSAPIHIATFFGASMERLTIFPHWHSLLEGASLYPVFAVAVARLRFRGAETGLPTGPAGTCPPTTAP
jgi:hypothetical protein